jgi:hypothetical protein
MKTFTIFWFVGNCEVVTGESVSDAFMRSGYGAGALRGVDFHSEGDIRSSYKWNDYSRQWVKV